MRACSAFGIALCFALRATAAIETQVVDVAVLAGGISAGAPTCGSGTHVIGGGFGDVSALRVHLNRPDLALDQWQVEMHSTNAAGSFRAAAICTDDPVDPVVETDTETVPASSDATTANVLCTLGTPALSGGSSVTGVPTQRPTIVTAPIWRQGLLGATSLHDRADGVQSAPAGWEAVFRNESTAVSVNGTVYATCAAWRGALAVVGSGTANPFSTASVFAFCPEGTFAVGGGIDTAQRDAVERIGSGPLVDTPTGIRALYEAPAGPTGAPHGWFGSLLVFGDTPVDFKVAAICVPEPSQAAAAAAAFAALALAARRS